MPLFAGTGKGKKEAVFFVIFNPPWNDQAKEVKENGSLNFTQPTNHSTGRKNRFSNGRDS